MNSEELRVKSTERKYSEGITLIALVITIIVLLILAMVSIRIITNQGIIGHAENATERYTAEQEKELIELAHADYKMTQMNNSSYTMQNALDSEQAGAIAEGDETSGWTITFNNSGNQYTLTNEGTVTPANGESGDTEQGLDQADIINNREEYLQKVAELGQNIEQNKDIGIGASGQLINLDNWNYNLLNGEIDLRIYASYGSTYKGTLQEIIDMPQYILIEGYENFCDVTCSDNLFISLNGQNPTYDDLNVVKVILVPNTINELKSYTFKGCDNIEIIIDNTEGAITGEPWGATNSTVTWLR